MFIAMNRFRVAKGSEAAFEQVWMSRDSHLDKVPGFVEFTFSKVPRLRITRSTAPTPSGNSSRHGPNPRHSGQRIVGQEITSPCIWIIRSSKGSRCARRWDATRRPERAR
jgi:Antibiotic biosynthesis monooxygenase